MKFKTAFVALALSVTVAGVSAAQDDDTRERRRELRDRIEELTDELHTLERERLRGGNFDIRVMPQAFGRVSPLTIFAGNRARMGISVRSRANARTDSIGAVVQTVTEDGPADEAGIAEGDIIISFDGERLAGRYPPASDNESEPAIKLIDLVGEREEGDVVVVELLRDGDRREVEVELRPVWPGVSVWSLRGNEAPFLTPSIEAETLSPPLLFMRMTLGDLELVSLDEDLGRYFGTSDGVLVVSTPSDESLNLRGGDVILSIDGREVSEPSRVFRILATYESDETIEMEIMRNQRRESITVMLPEGRRGGFLRRRW